MLYFDLEETVEKLPVGGGRDKECGLVLDRDNEFGNPNDFPMSPKLPEPVFGRQTRKV